MGAGVGAGVFLLDLVREVGVTRVVEVAATVGAGVTVVVVLVVGATVGVTLSVVEVVVVVLGATVGVAVGLMVGLMVGLVVGLAVGLAVGVAVVAALRRTGDALPGLVACASVEGRSRRARASSAPSQGAVRRRMFTHLPQAETRAHYAN